MKNKLQIFVIAAFLGLFAWWASFQHIVDQQGLAVQWFSSTYGLMALLGAVIGLITARQWGGFRTVLGKALTFFSLGLLAQEAGQLIYAYYIYVDKIQIPYPSIGDVAYFGSVILYIVAALFLTKAAGANLSLKHTKGKAVAIIVPVVLLATSYGVLLNHHSYDTARPLTVLLDFGYPIGQAIYISIALIAFILSRKLLGGVMKQGIILIILALFLQYIADFNFIYQSSRGTYLSGKYADLLYLISYFAMALAMSKFHLVYRNLRSTAAADAPQKTEDNGIT